MSISVRRRRLPAAAWLALAFALPAPVVLSAEAPITLRDALSRTLSSNPSLAADAHALRAQDGLVLQAGLRPNPSVSTEVENVLGSGDAAGIDRAEITLALSQVMEFGALRQARVAVAEQSRLGARVAADIQRFDILAETARRFVLLVSQQELHQLTHLGVELAEKTAEAVERRVVAAKAPLAEQERARVALEQARSRDAHAEHLLQSARHALAASWGAEAPDFGEASADLYQLPAVAPLPQLAAAVAQTPDIAQYLNETRLQSARIELAMAARRPGFELGAGIRHDAGSGDTGLVLSVQMPWALNDRQQGDIAAADALRQRAGAQQQAALVNARTQLFAYYRELEDLRRELTVIRDTTLPLMQDALEHTEYAYQRGRYSYLEWVDAQRALLSLRRDGIDAATAYHLTLIEIERLTGTAVSL